MNRETKSFKLKLKSVEDSGVFEGYASTYTEDLGGDVIKKGAFARTLSHNKNHVILWQHDPTKPIGAGLDAYEDSKGLYVKGQLCLEVQQAREARALMAQGALKGLSIGYESKQDEIDEESGLRVISEIQLYEYSPVSFPMNVEAQVTSVKALDTAVSEFMESLSIIKDQKNSLSRNSLEIAREAYRELEVILKGAGLDGDSSSGISPLHASSKRPDVKEIDPEMIHSIHNLRNAMKEATRWDK